MTSNMSLDEKARGVLLGPFEIEEDLGLGPVSLVPRRGIWELHGGATEPPCRVIGDLLFCRTEKHGRSILIPSSHRRGWASNPGTCRRPPLPLPAAAGLGMDERLF